MAESADETFYNETIESSLGYSTGLNQKVPIEYFGKHPADDEPECGEAQGDVEDDQTDIIAAELGFYAGHKGPNLNKTFNATHLDIDDMVHVMDATDETYGQQFTKEEQQGNPELQREHQEQKGQLQAKTSSCICNCSDDDDDEDGDFDRCPLRVNQSIHGMEADSCAEKQPDHGGLKDYEIDV